MYNESPAFKILDFKFFYYDPRSPRESAEMIALRVCGAIEQLDRLFAEGKASPGDIDENGNTLMHVCLCAF